MARKQKRKTTPWKPTSINCPCASADQSKGTLFSFLFPVASAECWSHLCFSLSLSLSSRSNTNTFSFSFSFSFFFFSFSQGSLFSSLLCLSLSLFIYHLENWVSFFASSLIPPHPPIILFIFMHLSIFHIFIYFYNFHLNFCFCLLCFWSRC